MTGWRALADVTPSVQTLVDESLPETKRSIDKIQLTNGFVYHIMAEEVHPFNQELNDLNSQELEKFKKRRRELLLQLSKVLSFNKISNGIGAVENNKLSMIKDRSITAHPVDALGEADSAVPDSQNPMTHQQKLSRRYKLLNKILSKADSFLFQNSHTVISSNEFGLELGLSLGSVMGSRGKFILGGALGIQLIFGFDMLNRKMSFQLKLFTEKASHGITGIFMPVGITPRIGGYMRANQNVTHSYDITYVPVAPVYIAKANGMATMGATAAITLLNVASGGLMAFFESAMSYQSHVRSVTILDSNTIRVSFNRFHDFFNNLRGFKSGPTCQLLFV